MAWQRRHVRRFEQRLGLPRIAQAFVVRNGLHVLDGPFAGMTYVSQAVGSAFVPKLLGSYESELHGALAEIIAKDFKTIVDVGCAEGYYAVGLALRMPSARVYAFDTDPAARKLCRDMTQVNVVSHRVTVAGKCDVENLGGLLQDRALVVCDCEGYERDLLCPERVPGLRRADVLVELHDCIDSSILQTIFSRFQATHEIALLTSVERDPSCYPALESLKAEDRRLAVSEFRSAGQQWAYMTPKAIRHQEASA